MAYIDFLNPKTFKPQDSSARSALVSFAPIWLLAPFLAALHKENPEAIKGISRIIACSSSSATTKKFAANIFDKSLSMQLRKAENLLMQVSHTLGISCAIIRPTLIYGKAGTYTDKNISKLESMLRILPLVILPKSSGLRQPIHAFQLAKVVLSQAAEESTKRPVHSILEIGGDETISYKTMLERMQKNLPQSNKCTLLEIPNRFFNFLASPLILISPKLFEAVLRVNSDLSGFQPAHELLNEKPIAFPARDTDFLNRAN